MRSVLLLFVIGILLTGCSGGIYRHIYSNYDHTVNFNAYKTYAWLNSHQPHEPTPYDNDIIENNIKNYVDKELASRNYISEIDAPDLLFELVLSNQKKVNVSAVPVYSSPTYLAYPSNSYRYFNGYNYRWNNLGYRNSYYVRPAYQIGSKIINTTFRQSTITIHVFSRTSNRLIWTGSATGDVYDNAYDQKDIHPAVIKILKRYPIQPLVAAKP